MSLVTNKVVAEDNVVDVFEPEAGGGEKYLTQLTGPEPGVPFTERGRCRCRSVRAATCWSPK